jgi:hypothetical protein
MLIFKDKLFVSEIFKKWRNGKFLNRAKHKEDDLLNIFLKKYVILTLPSLEAIY